VPRRQRLSVAFAFAFAALITLLASTAIAQPQPQPQPQPPQQQRKSALISSSLAIGGFAACMGGVVVKSHLFVDGHRAAGRVVEVAQVFTCVLGPSAGQWYTDSPWRVGISSGLRGGALILGSIGYAIDDRDTSDSLIVFGSTVFMGAIVYDLIAAPFAARRYNRRFDTMTLTPAPMITPSGAAPGLVLGGTF
jgi:hypothetical protein